MAWRVFEYVDAAGEGVITDWPLQKPHKAKLMQKIRMLRDLGPDLPPGLLAGPGIGGHHHIYKLRVQSNVQMRPMLCRGPINNDGEFTFLATALEKDDTLEPASAPDVAEQRRKDLIADPKKRRVLP